MFSSAVQAPPQAKRPFPLPPCPNKALRQERHKESTQTPLSDPLELSKGRWNRCHMMFSVPAAGQPCISCWKTGISDMIRPKEA